MSKQEPTIFDMAYQGKTAAVKILVNENLKLKTNTDLNGRMLLHWAALGGHNDLVKHLLSLDVPVDPKDDTCMTPLILAASAGRDRVVEILLAEGADVNSQTVDGHSALQYAASKNWQAICERLIEKGANVNVVDKRGATPLHRAASKGNFNIVKLLLAQDDIKIDSQDADGNTPLHLACEEDRQQEARLLVSAGASLTCTNKERKSPLDVSTASLVRQLTKIVGEKME